MVNVPWDIDTVRIELSSHFATKYGIAWHWTVDDVREALRYAYRIDCVGSRKYEAYITKKGFKKLIIAYNGESILCISGAQGGRKL